MSEEGGRVQWKFSCLQGEVRGILQGDGDCSKSVTVETGSTTQADFLAILALAPQKRIALFGSCTRNQRDGTTDFLLE